MYYPSLLLQRGRQRGCQVCPMLRHENSTFSGATPTWSIALDPHLSRQEWICTRADVCMLQQCFHKDSHWSDMPCAACFSAQHLPFAVSCWQDSLAALPQSQNLLSSGSRWLLIELTVHGRHALSRMACGPNRSHSCKSQVSSGKQGSKHKLISQILCKSSVCL